MGTIRDIGIKIKVVWRRLRENLLIVLVIILVALLAFGLGRLSVFYGGKAEFKVLYPNGQSASVIEGALGIGKASEEVPLPPQIEVMGQYVASKTGSTYFFPWCPLAVKIAVANRVYFKSRASAESAGYHAGRCNGM